MTVSTVTAKSTGVPSRMRALLLAANPDFTAIIHTLCDRAEIGLTVSTSVKHLLRTAAGLRAPDFLILDCSLGDPNDVDRCVHILVATELQVYILHPSAEFVHSLESFAPGRLTWMAPAEAGLVALEKLRLRRATARMPTTQPGLGEPEAT